MLRLQLIYLLIFVTVGFLFYQIFPKKYKYLVLLITSYSLIPFLSYFWTFFIVGASLATYGIGVWIGRRLDKVNAKKSSMEKEDFKALKKKVKKGNNWILFLGIFIVLGMLVVLKYGNFITSTTVSLLNLFGLNLSATTMAITLPLGISYYTLNALGYLIDVNRGKYPYEKNPLKIMLFVSFFPFLLEGPFGHYDKIGKQLSEPQPFKFENIKKGLLLIAFGLFKKLVIADRIAIFITQYYTNQYEYGGYLAILMVIGFTFQLYAEFSGMIDIAVGVSTCFGIVPEKNFDHPFVSLTVGEFWRRWHITLGTWFKEYVFYSISMSKPLSALAKKLRGKCSIFYQTFIPSVIALFVVWALTGLWHGASVKYLVYGLYYYVIMMLEMILEHHTSSWKCKNKFWYKALSWIRTFVLINIGMLIFRAPTLQSAFDTFISIFKIDTHSIVPFFEDTPLGAIQEISVLVIGLGIMLAIAIMRYKHIDIYGLVYNHNFMVPVLILTACVVVIVMFGAYGNGYASPDPIYGGF